MRRKPYPYISDEQRLAMKCFYSQNYRAKTDYELDPEFGFEDFFGWWKAHLHDICSCGAPALTIDHVVSMARGGAHSLHNFQKLCRPCNTRKAHWLDGEPRFWRRPKKTASYEAMTPELPEGGHWLNFYGKRIWYMPNEHP